MGPARRGHHHDRPEEELILVIAMSPGAHPARRALEPLPHDQDIKALLRLAVVWNIPVACNRSTADFLFASPLLFGDYERTRPDFTDYQNRKL